MAACLRMVLEYYGIDENESTLLIKSKTNFYGTQPIHAIECARSYGFDAYESSLSLEKLRNLVEQKIFQ